MDSDSEPESEMAYARMLMLGTRDENPPGPGPF